LTGFRATPLGEGRRIAIVISRFNGNVTGRLLAGARACLLERGVESTSIDEISVPGAWELPQASRWAADRGIYDAIIALGCVIRGETPHFDFVATAAADGLAEVSLGSRVPVTLGLLTTEDMDQALARAGGRYGNKGWEAAEAALEMAALRSLLESDDAGA